MAEPTTTSFWHLLSGAIALNPDAYRLMETVPRGVSMAFIIVLLAGFAEATAQAIVLFVNRVRPLRFIVSLALAALLFAIAFLIWAGTTWLVSLIVFQKIVNFGTLLRTLALSYAPRILSIFIALPYLGVPLSILLSIWSFLAFLVGLKAVLGFTLWQGFWCGLIGWALLQIVERTIGRPLANLGFWLRNVAAGVPLVTDLKQIEQIVGRRQS